MGARTSADHVLAAVSDGGQDRTAWPAGVFEDQRGHAGDVCGDPRALHARHAGRRRCSRNVVIIWRFRFRDPSRRARTVDGGVARKTPRQRQNRRPKPPPRGSTRRRRPPCDAKRAENPPSDPRGRVTQNPIVDFGLVADLDIAIGEPQTRVDKLRDDGIAVLSVVADGPPSEIIAIVNGSNNSQIVLVQTNCSNHTSTQSA
jgi:hypothetical protein